MDTPDTPQAPRQSVAFESYGGDIAPIIDALVKAQSKFDDIKRTRDGQQGNRRFRYAPPDEIQRATRPALIEAKLAIVSYLRPIGATMFVVSELRLGGNDGFLRSVFPMTPGLATQDRGKEITYGRRYNTNALLDLAADEDADDTGLPESDNEAAQRKADAAAMLDALKAKGANVTPVAPVEDKQEPAAESSEADESLDGIAPALAALMAKAKITPAQLKAYYVSKGHLTDNYEPTDLPAEYVVGLTKPANWKKAVEAIKEAAK